LLLLLLLFLFPLDFHLNVAVYRYSALLLCSFIVLSVLSWCSLGAVSVKLCQALAQSDCFAIYLNPIIIIISQAEF